MWSPYGRYVYVALQNLSAVRIRLEDHAIEVMGSIESEPWMFATAGPWLGLALEDGSAMYLRDERSQHIYALDWQD